MYVLLTGARKNAGDYLIAHAAKRLISLYTHCGVFHELPSWLPISGHLDLINSAKALILCGGPAIQSGLGSRIYPILADLPEIKVPIIAFGLGWKAMPGDEYQVEHASLNPCPEPLLRRIREDFPYAGCRDYLTLRVMHRIGLSNALMTGCPAWYDPDCFESPVHLPGTIERVLVTPAEHPFFRDQSQAFLRIVHELFPKAERVCSFHRGWTTDEFTTHAHAENARKIKEAAESLGYETWDASGGLTHIERYKEFDLHVGYRVHAHFKFLSMKRPSFLIAEDARGRGALEAIAPIGVMGYRASSTAHCSELLAWPPILSQVLRHFFQPYYIDLSAPERMRTFLLQEVVSGYPHMQGAFKVIESTWPRMLQILRAMPD